jgi:hypothetical protein
MKFLFLFLFSALSFAASTPKDFALNCSTSVAGVGLYADGERMRFQLFDGQGFKNFPIYGGIVTPAMMPLINRGLKELAPFDGDVEISWDLAHCKVDPARPYLLACSGLGEIAKPFGVAFVATSMSTSTEKVESLDVNATGVQVNLGLSTSGSDFMHYFVQFPFDQNHCSVK